MGVYFHSIQHAATNESKLEASLRGLTVTHALVQVHPVTGRKSLYFDPWTVTGIVGMKPEAAMDTLKHLQEFTTRPEFTYEHKWQVGDVVMWDNGFMLHRRDAYNPNQRRFHKRTTIALSPERHIVPKGELLTL